MNVALQPLRIPAGWSVTLNDFGEIAPSTELSEVEQTGFKEDLFQAVHHSRKRLLDLGWYPSGDLQNGAFRVVLCDGDFRGKLLNELRTRDLSVAVATIERFMADVCDERI